MIFRGELHKLLQCGEAVDGYRCNTCHGPEMFKPGTAALAIKYRGELPGVNEQSFQTALGEFESAVGHGDIWPKRLRDSSA